LTADFSFPENRDGNLGPANLSLGFKPPDGAGLAIDRRTGQGRRLPVPRSRSRSPRGARVGSGARNVVSRLPRAHLDQAAGTLVNLQPDRIAARIEDDGRSPTEEESHAPLSRVVVTANDDACGAEIVGSNLTFTTLRCPFGCTYVVHPGCYSGGSCGGTVAIQAE
jgi:hypothetical protein